jgi:hypothetical protein
MTRALLERCLRYVGCSIVYNRNDSDEKHLLLEAICAELARPEAQQACKPADTLRAWANDTQPPNGERWHEGYEAARRDVRELLAAQKDRNPSRVEADAARYQYLKQFSKAASIHMDGNHCWTLRQPPRLHHFLRPSFDAAVDAAIAEEKETP